MNAAEVFCTNGTRLSSPFLDKPPLTALCFFAFGLALFIFAGDKTSAFDGRHDRTDAFVTLSDEAAFWIKWKDTNHDGGYLDPFFYSDEIRRPIDKQLRTTAKDSKDFVLVVVSCVNHGTFRVISLARNEKWHQHEWNLGRNRQTKESDNETPVVSEESLERISNSNVFLKSGDAFDSASVFVYIRYKGASNRLAVYNSSRALGEESKQTETSIALRNVLNDVGVMRSTKQLKKPVIELGEKKNKQ